RGPVATLDDSRIEVDRMDQRLEMTVARSTSVPLGLEFLQHFDQMIGRHDRVRTGGCMRDMDGMAADFEAKPDDPNLRTHHPAAGRLRDETGVRAVTPLQRRERTDTGALLLDDGLKVNPRGR